MVEDNKLLDKHEFTVVRISLFLAVNKTFLIEVIYWSDLNKKIDNVRSNKSVIVRCRDIHHSISGKKS